MLSSFSGPAWKSEVRTAQNTVRNISPEPSDLISAASFYAIRGSESWACMVDRPIRVIDCDFSSPLKGEKQCEQQKGMAPHRF